MRAEIALGGTDPGPLGSFRDITLRSVLIKMKLAETHKLMVQAAAATNNVESAQKSIRSYSASVWYEDHTHNSYKDMERYYLTHMKNQEVSATVGEDGSINVTGIT
tara:strand:+ start:2145 stop:2462 length:318 start_codon:yes stop_codon:yes gene_type:complete